MSGPTDRRVRVGIDVGGTFTDVVAVDADSRAILGQLKVPTTHRAPEGVALGIVQAIDRIAESAALAAGDVIFIAHATTQATNALLEGDVARVGVVGMGRGLEAWKARHDTRVPPIPLAPGRSLAADHRFVPLGPGWDRAMSAAIGDLRRAGVGVVVPSAAFAVDHPEDEREAARLAREAGLLATCGHDVSMLYGLRTRTRTAVLNAALLPKMMETARMTEAAVARAGITSPLMVMRSDGGVMSVAEIERRPILTMLSGPAAGVAGALMHERVSDGIFLEVGGTSTDISVIRDGLPQMRPARIGGHRTCLNTLDVRTVGIAGGSLIRHQDGRIVDVGPRSAHIAGLAYACFAAGADFGGATLVHLRPSPGDAGDYAAVECRDGARYALTPTCAANVLGLVPAGCFARGDRDRARAAFGPLARALGLVEEDAAARVLDVAAGKVVAEIRTLVTEYHLRDAVVDLVGGGGGAAALVPHAARLVGLPHRLARSAEVISTIGVALAMVRDSVERTIVDPSPADVLRVRREAADAAIRSGARPDTVDVHVEVDPRRALVRATAFGTTEFTSGGGQPGGLDAESGAASAARSMNVEPREVTLLGGSAALRAYGARRTRRRLGLIPVRTQMVRVVDMHGVVRLQRPHAEVIAGRAASLARDLDEAIARLTEFGDAGRAIPDLHVLVGARIVDLSGLATADQVQALAEVELDGWPPEERIAIVAAPRT